MWVQSYSMCIIFGLSFLLFKKKLKGKKKKIEDHLDLLNKPTFTSQTKVHWKKRLNNVVLLMQQQRN